LVGYVATNYFSHTDFQHKKDLPPVAVLAKNIVMEKENQFKSGATKRKHEMNKKKRVDNTMVAFSNNILPAAEGCHPSITIGTNSSKLMKYDSLNALQRDMSRGTATDGTGETMVTMPSMDDEFDDEEDDEDDNDLLPFAPEVDEDGTKHYTTADGKKTLSYKKNAPQNGKL
jgi:hypothetical protein